MSKKIQIHKSSHSRFIGFIEWLDFQNIYFIYYLHEQLVAKIEGTAE